MRALWLVPFVMLVTSTVFGYQLTGTTWDMTSHPEGVTWCPRVETAGAASPASEAQLLDALRDAMARWSYDALPCSAFRARESSACNGEPSAESQQNFVYWESAWDGLPVGASTYALTLTWSTGDKQDASTVLFNGQDHTWRVDGGEVDVGSIATHEFGHFVGLAHHDQAAGAAMSNCSSASGSNYPSVMCTDHPGGVVQILTQDDVDGVCALYAIDGEQGAPCTTATECISGECHPNGFCTESCSTTADCPSSYECLSGLCERILPDGVVTDCGACGWLECLSRSFCLEADGVSFCSRPCDEDVDCPVGFGCYPLQGLGSGCYPWANSCSTEGPATGDFCALGDICALGNICIDQDNEKRCRWLCRSSADCPGQEGCIDRGGVSFCDGQSGEQPEPSGPSDACSCDLLFGCEEGCACDPDCQTDPNGPCECNRSDGCDPQCKCDRDCSGCACNSSRAWGGLWLLLGLAAMRGRHRWKGSRSSGRVSDAKW